METPSTGPSPEDPPQRRPSRPRSRRWALGAALLAPVLLASCKVPSFGAYPGATTQARSAYHLFQGFFIAGIVVGGLVFLLILWAVLRYRKKGDTIPHQTQYHTVLEIAYTVIPIIIVCFLFAFTFNAENIVDATPPHPQATVEVQAFQWGWEFTYARTNVDGHSVDPVTIAGQRIRPITVIGATTQAPIMEIPTGSDVQVYLTSLDVIHGFYVPAFNFSRYAQPGVVNTFDFNVLSPGTYRGQCTQLCGLYHSLMFFYVKAVSPAQYDQWLMQHSGQTLNAGVGILPNGRPVPGAVGEGPTNSTGSTNGAGY